MQIEIRKDQRVFFCGRVGSGKTTLARAYLAGVSNFAVLDPKHTFRMADVPIRATYTARDNRQIIRSEDGWEQSLYGIWRRHNIVCYIDEATLVNEGYGVRLSPMLGRIIRTGRELNVAAWIGTQRPKDIPSAVFTETEHFFIFQLNWKEDRKKVVSFTSSDIAPYLDELQGHEFIYYNVLDNSFVKGELREKATARRQ